MCILSSRRLYITWHYQACVVLNIHHYYLLVDYLPPQLTIAILKLLSYLEGALIYYFLSPCSRDITSK